MVFGEIREDRSMSLTKRSIELLLDLVEIKISYMDISDREDARDLQLLERCRAELKALDRGETATVVAIAAAPRRPTSPRTTTPTHAPALTARPPLVR
jgi:hypothetical protein